MSYSLSLACAEVTAFCATDASADLLSARTVSYSIELDVLDARFLLDELVWYQNHTDTLRGALQVIEPMDDIRLPPATLDFSMSRL